MGGFFLALVLVAVVGAVIWYIKRRRDLEALGIEVDPNIFEQGERSVKLCEGEDMIRAYNCAQLKSIFLRTMRAKGILTITNKRVVFHTIGIKNDEDFIHHEVPIQKVSSVSVQSGVAAEGAIFAFLPSLAMIPGGKVKRIFTLDIHAEGVSGDNGAISVAPTDAKGTAVSVPSYDMIPTDIVVQMANEIGAMISDFQTMGDLAIEKWKQ